MGLGHRQAKNHTPTALGETQWHCAKKKNQHMIENKAPLCHSRTTWPHVPCGHNMPGHDGHLVMIDLVSGATW